MNRQGSAPLRAITVGLVAVWVLWSTAVFAESTLVEEYSAPEFCPTRDWFEVELGSRANTRADAEARLRITVTADGERFVGRVQTTGNATGDAREVRHANCEQVVRALALIGALLLDPNARNEDQQLSEIERRLDAPPAPPPTVVAAKPSRDPRVASRVPRSSSSSSTSVRLTHGPFLALAALSHVAPDLRFGPRVGYRLIVNRPALANRSFAARTELGVSFARFESGSLVVSGIGTADLTANLGRLQICHALALTASVFAGACALLEAGRLDGRGTIAGGTTVARGAWWMSPGTQGRLEWLATGLLTLQLGAGLEWPLARQDYYFADRESSATRHHIYQAPESIGFSGDFSLGLLFP